MSSYWNFRTKNLSPYVPGEQPKDRQFIKLNTNENPYPPSPKVIEAIKKAANEKLRLYPDPECTDFREAVAQHYRIRTEQVFAGNGSDEILGFAFGAFFECGQGAKEILFPDITYSFYPVYAGLWEIPYRTIPLTDNFSINITDYEISSNGGGAIGGGAIGGGAINGVVFPNPNAPTGMALPLPNILSLAKFLEKQGKVLILDEAYIAFGSESAVPYINDHPNLLVVHTLSKSASLAGLRAAYAIGSNELIEGLRRMRDSFNSYTLDRLALAGAAAAVSDSAYYDAVNCRTIATRKRVTETLENIGCTVLPSAANFIFMKMPGIQGGECFSALREKGILVRHFNRERIADFIRVSIGTDKEMDIFLDACGAISGEISGAIK
jgi:histidinol-phosphate aminotransferase